MHTLDPETNIKTYIAQEILDGEDIGELTKTTPLLELGLLNSIELMKLVSHIETTYNLKVPSDAVVPGNFQDIQAISQLVTELTKEMTTSS